MKLRIAYERNILRKKQVVIPVQLPDDLERHFVAIGDFGHKNIDCPKYEDCLDDACQYNLPFWICNGCENEFVFLSESQI